MTRFLLLLLVLAAGGAGYAWYDYQRYLEAPRNTAALDGSFTIERGWSAKRVGQALLEHGVIDKPWWFELHARQSGKAARIKSGEFVIDGDLTVPELLDRFVAGKTRQYRLTAVEGSRYTDLLARVRRHDELEQTLELRDPQTLMDALGFDGEHPEGQFFADTYRFPKGTSDVAFLKRAKRTLDRVLAEEWEARAPDLPLETPYEALILASIVEKETAVPAERPEIAGVFVSRLRLGMRLQTDPTVIYGMGDRYDGNIRRSDLTRDTPYNTYTRAGLPPTPIALVGRDALHAVMHPKDTTALYFVSRGDGTHQFSETIEEHNAAVRKYQLNQ